MGYSPCKMADFQNRLHSQLFVVNFSSGFCTEQLLCSSRMVFRMFLEFFYFWLKLTILQRLKPLHGLYSLCKMADFQSRLIFRILGVVWSLFFGQNNSKVLVELFIACFRNFQYLTQTHHFAKARREGASLLFSLIRYSLCMGYNFCKLADFQNHLISRIFAFFSSRFFAQSTSNVLVEWFFACFWHF